ncbi:MAG: hypothetical protein AAFP97_08665 [Pseudomonadota bacterium]
MKLITRQMGMQAVLAAILAVGTVAPAQAQLGDLKRFTKKQAEKKAKKEIEKAINGAPTGTTTTTNAGATQTAAAGGSSGRSSTPKPIELTQCDSLRPSKIVYGKLGDYTFSQGMSTEERTGFINRRDVSFESGCILPNLESREVMYLEYDTNALGAAGWPNAYETQCVKIDDRAYGALNTKETRSEYPDNEDYLKDAHLRLACGNSEGISECTNGSNSDRATAASKDLKARGKTALSFFMPTTRRGDTPKSGERLYCQFYNTDSGKSLFGFEYFREYG